jgi:hypothetical protein
MRTLDRTDLSTQPTVRAQLNVHVTRLVAHRDSEGARIARHTLDLGIGKNVDVPM